MAMYSACLVPLRVTLVAFIPLAITLPLCTRTQPTGVSLVFSARWAFPFRLAAAPAWQNGTYCRHQGRADGAGGGRASSWASFSGAYHIEGVPDEAGVD